MTPSLVILGSALAGLFAVFSFVVGQILQRLYIEPSLGLVWYASSGSTLATPGRCHECGAVPAAVGRA